MNMNFYKRYVRRIWRRFYSRYVNHDHVIDIRNETYSMTPYRGGYLDQDHRMLLASFKCLVDFVEKEHPFDVVNWDNVGKEDFPGPEYWAELANAKREIQELYNWWTVDRKRNEMAAYDAKPPEMYALMDKCENDDDLYLARLVKIRRYLWT